VNRLALPLLTLALWALLPAPRALAQEIAGVSSWTSPELPRGLSLDPERPTTILLLTSGEWVRGELDYIEDGELHLDGAKSADKTYDLEEVLEVYSNELVQVTFQDETKLRAREFVIDGEARVLVLDADGQAHSRLRARLVTVYPIVGDNDPLLQRWRGKITLGLTATFGNTRTATLQGTASLVQQTGDWRFSLQAEASQGRAGTEETDKSRRGQLQVDYDLNLRTYLTLGYAEASYDKFQNIGIRLRGGSGAGLRLIREIDLHWVVEATGIGTYTEFRHVEAGEKSTEAGAALRLATRLWTELLDDDLKFEVHFESFLGLHDIEDTTHHLVLTISYKVVADFTLSFTAIFDRNENPEPRADGTRPQRDDLSLSLGFGWEL
jgi:putative salt-induced outer membrane protein YdiY